jgi:hypothetical protein
MIHRIKSQPCLLRNSIVQQSRVWHSHCRYFRMYHLMILYPTARHTGVHSDHYKLAAASGSSATFFRPSTVTHGRRRQLSRPGCSIRRGANTRNICGKDGRFVAWGRSLNAEQVRCILGIFASWNKWQTIWNGWIWGQSVGASVFSVSSPLNVSCCSYGRIVDWEGFSEEVIVWLAGGTDEYHDTPQWG